MNGILYSRTNEIRERMAALSDEIQQLNMDLEENQGEIHSGASVLSHMCAFGNRCSHA